MTNLIMLGMLDPAKMQEWRNADRKTRLNKFSPAAVRRMLKTKSYACATDEWYRELSEGCTHITPETQPNFHGDSPWIGGRFDEGGAATCYGKLIYVLTMLSMFISKYFGFEDLFQEISAKMDRLRPDMGKHVAEVNN
jgi:hypothetical protein